MRDIIEQTLADLQHSEGVPQLTSGFFLALHQLQAKFSRLRFGHKLKQSEAELLPVMEQLVASYTDCIDHFSLASEGAEAYFQAKLKDISKYYQLFRTATETTSSQGLTSTLNEMQETDSIQDLGSIASQPSSVLGQLIQDHQHSLDTKDLLNQSLMACLQHQNITGHLRENMKKKQKAENKITETLQKQVDDVQRRIRNRKIKISKKKVSQSFSDQITFQADLRRKDHPPETYDHEHLTNFDIEALDADSPQQLRQLVISKGSQVIPNDQGTL